jgi:GNAT superfamily N-acetyltransferase
MDDVKIREAAAADVPALARLDVQAFSEAHLAGGAGGPTLEVRERQWSAAFEAMDGAWFCFVAECRDSLVGLAAGKPYSHPDHPEYSGELNKIYLLRAHHRRGVGRRLVGHVARRLLARSVSSMLLFGDADNPSNRFYEALGAERLFAANGDFHGGYGWRDLEKLVLICPLG